MVEVAQGEIWWAELPEPAGSGPGFRRPVVVVQGTPLNRSRIATVRPSPGRALGAHPDDGPRGVALRHGAAAAAGHEGRGHPHAGADDGVQVAGVAEQRWRRLNGAQLLPLVRAGVRFVDGGSVEGQEDKDRKDAA